MHRYYILEGLFVLLGLALLVAAIRYPKDVFIKIEEHLKARRAY